MFEANRDVAYMHGMMAFAYEQCHLLEEAEAAAREAIRRKRREPWAQHALAHVMITTGRIDEGAAFLEGAKDGWVGLNSFMYTHLWWHLALFYLSQGRSQAVLAIYDPHVWGIAKTYSQDQIGAVSLLARLELAGIDVGERWRDLGEHLAARGPDTAQPFLTIQYLYGLARAGRAEADALMAAVRERARTAPDFADRAWREVAVPVGEGLLAYARGDYAAAEARLPRPWRSCRSSAAATPSATCSNRCGLTPSCAAADGRWPAAAGAAAGQRPRRRAGHRALAWVYAELDLPKEAAKAEARAHRTLAAYAAKVE